MYHWSPNIALCMYVCVYPRLLHASSVRVNRVVVINFMSSYKLAFSGIPEREELQRKRGERTRESMRSIGGEWMDGW